MYTSRYIVIFIVDGITLEHAKVRLPLYETDGLEFDEVFDKIVEIGKNEVYKQSNKFVPDWATALIRKEED